MAGDRWQGRLIAASEWRIAKKGYAARGAFLLRSLSFPLRSLSYGGQVGGQGICPPTPPPTPKATEVKKASVGLRGDSPCGLDMRYAGYGICAYFVGWIWGTLVVGGRWSVFGDRCVRSQAVRREKQETGFRGQVIVLFTMHLNGPLVYPIGCFGVFFSIFWGNGSLIITRVSNSGSDLSEMKNRIPNFLRDFKSLREF